jgi:hypothetical protein
MPRLDAQGRPDESLGLIALPVGVTTFFESGQDARRYKALLRQYDGGGTPTGLYDPDECARLADHVRPLVPGVYGGVSLEFRPDGPEGVAYKAIGPSPMLSRPALHFFKTRMVGLASACDIPVNQFAGYVRLPDEVLARAEKALRVYERPDIPGVVRKSLSPLVRLLKSTPSGRVTAPVRRPPAMPKPILKRVRKADEFMEEDEEFLMDDLPPEDMDPPPVDDVPADPMAMDDAADMPATAAAAMQGAQGVADVCAMVRDLMQKGEHIKGRKKLSALCDQLDKVAAEYQAVADMVLADVGDGDAETEADMPDEVAPVELDDEGMIEAKSLKGKRWRPMRAAFVKASVYRKAAKSPWKLSDLRPVSRKAKPGQVLVDADHLKTLEAIAAAVAGTK